MQHKIISLSMNVGIQQNIKQSDLSQLQISKVRSILINEINKDILISQSEKIYPEARVYSQIICKNNKYNILEDAAQKSSQKQGDLSYSHLLKRSIKPSIPKLDVVCAGSEPMCDILAPEFTQDSLIKNGFHVSLLSN